MKSLLGKPWEAWNRFWFGGDARVQLSVLRFVSGILLLVFYSIRTADLEFFYSESGVLPLEVMKTAISMEYRWTVLSWVQSVTALHALHALFLASLLTLALGYFPRVSSLIAWVLHLSFLHRNLPVAFGADFVASFQLLYLALAQWGLAARPGTSMAMLAPVAYRLVQVQLCVVYGFAGMHKLKGPRWWMGEAIWDVLANPQYARFDFTAAAQFPLLIALMTYLTLAWEVYFPVLVWIRPIRAWVLALGVGLHLGLATMMGLPFFSALMVANYSVFLSVPQAERLIRWARSGFGFRKKPEIAYAS